MKEKVKLRKVNTYTVFHTDPKKLPVHSGQKRVGHGGSLPRLAGARLSHIHSNGGEISIRSMRVFAYMTRKLIDLLFHLVNLLFQLLEVFFEFLF